MPSDPALIVRALRACRNILIQRVLTNVKPFGEVYILAHNVQMAIDALADRLTGKEGYFRIGGSSAGEGELDERRRREARESGETHWDG